MGSAIYLAASNTLFSTSLAEKIAEEAPSLNADLIIAAGATAFRTIVPEDLIPAVLIAYVESIDLTFFIALGLGVVAFAAAWGMRGDNTQKTRKDPDEDRRSLVLEMEYWRNLNDYSYSGNDAGNRSARGKRESFEGAFMTL